MNKKRWLAVVGLVVVLMGLLTGLALYQNRDLANTAPVCKTCQGQAKKDAPVEEITKIRIGSVLQAPPGQEAASQAAMANLSERMTKQLGIPVEWQSATSESQLQEAAHNKTIELAILSSVNGIGAEQSLDLDPMLELGRLASARRAEFLVRADSPLQSLQDLIRSQGLVWAFQSKNSDTAYLLPKWQLQKLGDADPLSHLAEREGKTPADPVVAVLDRQADFATVIEDYRTAMQSQFPDLMQRTRVIGYTEPVPDMLLLIRPGIKDTWQKKIQAALLRLGQEPEFQKLLTTAFGVTHLQELQPVLLQNARDFTQQLKEETAWR
jgi:phosphonate transport system substrate-binding protein